MNSAKLIKRCPVTRKIIGLNHDAWPKWALLFTGFVAVLWYLVRVVPKPARAGYPCLEVSAPLRWVWFAYIASILFSAAALLRSRQSLRRGRPLATMVFGVIFGLGIVLAITSDTGEASAGFIGCESPGEVANQPIGTARGIHPGRVAWVHDPSVASYDGTGNWWSDANNDQAAADAMVNDAIRTVSGKEVPEVAWDAIFRWFNTTQGKSNVGYQAGEKIAIKINCNNQQAHPSNNNINGNPTLILAVLKSLIHHAKVPPNLITVFEPSRAIGDNIYNKCRAVFPDVVFVDHFGGNGREKAEYIPNAIHYSANNGSLATGLATVAVETSYLINMALFKGHQGTGVTFGAKNMYGMTSISNDHTQNRHNNFSPTVNCSPRYMTFTDWMAHRDMGGKTLLWIMNAIYPTVRLGGSPQLEERWQMPPFNGHWASSILVSLDGVANDSVSLDFLRAEWNDIAVRIEYADQYLHEAALANAPPSGTFYNPGGDGSGAPSLGAHEHWNNPTDRQYSRNLGTGDGIELVYVGNGVIPVSLCGDQTCSPDESCSSCEEDCGPCNTGTGGTGGTAGSGTGGTAGSGTAGTGGTAGSGTGGTAGSGIGGTAGTDGAAGTGGNSTGGSGAAAGTAGNHEIPDGSNDESSGCACRATGSSWTPATALLAGFFFILAFVRSRWHQHSYRA